VLLHMAAGLFINFQTWLPREVVAQVGTPYTAAAVTQVAVKEPIGGLSVIVYDAEDFRHTFICSQIERGIMFFSNGVQTDRIALNGEIGNGEREGDDLLRL